MSGTLVVNDRDVWDTAGWVFRNVLSQVSEVIATSSPDLALLFREATSEQGLEYADLRSLPAARLRDLLRALESVRARTLADGPSSFRQPEFFDGYVRQLGLLVDMVRRDARVIPP